MPGPHANDWTALPVTLGWPLRGFLLPLNPEDTVPGDKAGVVKDRVARDQIFAP